VNFYNTVLDRELRTGEFMGVAHGFFQDKKGESGGAVIHSKNATPSAKGPLIYILVDNVDDVVGRVGAAGGAVIVPKTAIGPQGTIAVIEDTEGNHVGLHAV
jgi:predicted enzyme related to lactoylglutathione lyase